MRNFLLGLLVSAFVVGVSPVATAAAGDLKLTIGNGRVTLIAQEVPLRQILAEWARLGQTTIVNAEKLNGPPLTLQLVDRPEREVLEVLLRSASGYIASQRPVALANASAFERVMILPVSRGPVGVPAAQPPQFGRPNAGPPMQMPPPVADDDEPMDPNVPMTQPTANQPAPPFPGFPPQQPNPNQQPGQQQPAPPMTAPRPGLLPAPPGGQPLPPGAQPPNVRPPGANRDPDGQP
jgi:hypothetical protein